MTVSRCVVCVDTGSLFQTRCTSCGVIETNYNSPIVPALKDKGYVYISCIYTFTIICRAPDPDAEDARIPIDQLPK